VADFGARHGSDQKAAEFGIDELIGNPSVQGAQRASDDRPCGMLDIRPITRV
jgi:hypothetical protein